MELVDLLLLQFVCIAFSLTGNERGNNGFYPIYAPKPKKNLLAQTHKKCAVGCMLGV